MHFHVLGASAGGGLPQWNCACKNCDDARAGKIPTSTQSSLAVSTDRENWSLLNASPDLRQQFLNPIFTPRTLRDTPLVSCLLSNGDIDHIAGLLSLREQTAFKLFATRDLLDILAHNPVFDALNPNYVDREAIKLNKPFALQDNLETTLFPVPGKVPLFMEKDEVKTDLIGEQTVGVRMSHQGKTAYYIPACADVSDQLLTRLGDADLLFFDGTLFVDDEMIQTSTSQKTGQRMGHISIFGENGSIAKLRSVQARKIYIHINNTNPILQPDSEARKFVKDQGWEIAYDGMEVSL